MRVESRPKEDVFSYCFVLNPSLLLNIGNRASDLDWLVRSNFEVLTKKFFPELVELVGCFLHFSASKVIYAFLWDINHVANKSRKQTTLARAHVSNDANKFTLSNLQIDVLQSSELT